MKFICRKHFTSVLFLLLESPKSFNELLKILKAYPDTLGRRIRELSELGLIVAFESDRRLKYRLTDKGEKVAKLLKEIEKLEEKIDEIVMRL
ncbi:MAG: winged helix-turn-helix transcriptional regulator [Archaeoglobus sp.]|nr:winged helix-turn-helix transcriptional regulator [Archaeoglobus sp.]